MNVAGVWIGTDGLDASVEWQLKKISFMAWRTGKGSKHVGLCSVCLILPQFLMKCGHSGCEVTCRWVSTFWRNMLPRSSEMDAQYIPPKRWYPPTSSLGVAVVALYGEDRSESLSHRELTLRSLGLGQNLVKCDGKIWGKNEVTEKCVVLWHFESNDARYRRH
jgi:hypothetical protein